MAFDGKITKLDDNAFSGWFASLTFDVDITLTENPYKKKETHPDYEVTTKTPRGRYIRIGSAWNAKSDRTGNEYLSIVVSVNGQEVRVNGLRNEGDPDGEYRLVPLAG